MTFADATIEGGVVPSMSDPVERAMGNARTVQTPVGAVYRIGVRGNVEAAPNEIRQSEPLRRVGDELEIEEPKLQWCVTSHSRPTEANSRYLDI